MTAYLRKPNKVPDKVRKEIEIIIGDIFDAEKVAEALKGKDVVISCLGIGFNIGNVRKINNVLFSTEYHARLIFRHAIQLTQLPGLYVPTELHAKLTK